MENNLSYQTVKPLGISQIGSRDPLQDLTRPDSFTPTDGLDDLADQGFTITGEDVLDTALDFIPVAGGIKDIYKGVRDGDGWQVAIGAGSIVLDIFTLGGASIVKGAVVVGIKAGGKTIAKKVTKNQLKKRAANARRLGKIGERLAGIPDNLRKTAIKVQDRTRIPDRLTRTQLIEVKNVKRLNFTRQLKDFSKHADDTGREFILWTRLDTDLSRPLEDAINNGVIKRKKLGVDNP